jgi:hypothetical protein
MSDWPQASIIMTMSWTCGFCDREVSSNKGWARVVSHGRVQGEMGWLALCPRCDLPTFLDEHRRPVAPRPPIGSGVDHLPPEIGLCMPRRGAP